MALFTTYLGFLRNYNDPAKKFMYVMRNRGNNQVAPSKELLEQFLRDKKLFEEYGEWETRGISASWPQYKKKYLKLLESEQAKAWMKKVAEESRKGDVVLVCYCGPRSGKHCHRFLLARRMQELHDLEYKGELTDA